jgi:hypothetical protein
VAEPIAETDGFTPVFWQAPRLVMKDNSERLLTDLPWTRADAQWDSAAIKKDANGQATGLKAQASVVLEYALPAGSVHFKATAGVDAQAQNDAPGHVRIMTVVGTAANEDLGPGLAVEVNLTALAGPGPVRIRDLWTSSDLGEHQGVFAPIVAFHGAKLYRLSKVSAK